MQSHNKWRLKVILQGTADLFFKSLGYHYAPVFLEGSWWLRVRGGVAGYGFGGPVRVRLVFFLAGEGQHYINMSVVPIDRRLYCSIAVRTPTVGDGRRTVGATDMFMQ